MTESKMLDEVTVAAVRAESLRAHLRPGRHGRSLFDPAVGSTARLAALGAEFGEVCRAVTHDHSEGKDHLVTELIRVASVALTWAQCLDENGEIAP